ncbi:MAG: hypothetical protein M3N25_08840 [Actinomycetota bacterium]|nr:hypothetical protein [Actinomycetota bacterium]
MLVEGAARHNPELAACIVLAADTGARRGSYVGLRWPKVDLLGVNLRIDGAKGEESAGAYEKDQWEFARHITADQIERFLLDLVA